MVDLAYIILRHPGSVLRGQSLGAVLIARVMANWPQLPMGAALLLAPAESKGSDPIGQFVAIPDTEAEYPDNGCGKPD